MLDSNVVIIFEFLRCAASQPVLSVQLVLRMVRGRGRRFTRSRRQPRHDEAAHRQVSIKRRRRSRCEVGVRGRRHFRNQLFVVHRRFGLDRGWSRDGLARRDRNLLLHRQTGRSRKKQFNKILDVVKRSFSFRFKFCRILIKKL